MNQSTWRNANLLEELFSDIREIVRLEINAELEACALLIERHGGLTDQSNQLADMIRNRKRNHFTTSK